LSDGSVPAQAKGKASFCEQKEAKKLYDAGPWALALTTPMAQHRQKFKRPLCSLREAGLEPD
jgi:hypothetical protein